MSREQAKKQKNASRAVASIQAQIESEKAGASEEEEESVEGSATSESAEDLEDEARESPKPNHTTTLDEGSKPAKVCLFLCLVAVCSTRTML